MPLDVLRLTEDLVALDSAPGCSTGPVITRLVEQLSALGAHVRVQAGEHDGVPQQNLVARFGGDASAGLVLAGHVDTVPWDAAMRATTRPERDGRRLYGRGACDMKGPVAAQLVAVAARREALRRPLVLAFTYAEEVGCHGAVHLVTDAALVGDVSDAVGVVGEPTGMTPIIGHKGYVIAYLDLFGVPAHSSDPWAGADASVVLADLLARLHALREALRDEGAGSGFSPAGTVLNTGLVSAGSARNVVPDRARVVLELRPLPGTDVAALRARVEACLAAACEGVAAVSGAATWIEEQPPFEQSPDASVVDWLVQRTGRASDVVRFYTEAEIYRRGLGIPFTVCGPGSIDQAHRVDESIAFDELEAGVALYADTIDAFCT